ncbi:hypothetical protein TIFTF001_011620 [Ficus carica]|uniref:Uncharacterized protein n=1 Tax=Ficus carica TaxID=3494 RepID=A0AA87ZS31_FICCA|nr:hypothetical protein TIFTF001_011620 [Ficus carica]
MEPLEDTVMETKNMKPRDRWRFCVAVDEISFANLTIDHARNGVGDGISRESRDGDEIWEVIKSGEEIVISS